MADRVERGPAGALCSSFIRNEALNNAVEGEIIREVIAAAPTEQRADSTVITPHRAQHAPARSARRDSSARMKLAVAPIAGGRERLKNP